MKMEVVINIIVGLLSFLLSAISVITVIITLKQNKRLLESNKHQIDEMRREHQLSIQPIINVKSILFRIERPRFFYSPPNDEFSFQSRYYCDAVLCNLGNATAISVDATTILVVPQDDSSTELQSIDKRISLISGAGGTAEYNEMIAGDAIALFYSAIRESGASNLPQIQIRTTYKNACGGFFLSKQKYLLVPDPEELSMIQTWHTAIKSASTIYQEALAKLKKTQHNEEWGNLFDKVKNEFSLSLGDAEQKSIIVQCVEIPETYTFSVLTEEEYTDIVKKYSYPHFVHKEPNCDIPK